MKIVRGKNQVTNLLKDIRIGECLIFEFAPHQKHKDGDVFMHIDVSSYPPDEYRMRRGRDKLPVVNMRTGCIAFIDRNRPCYAVDTALHLED